MSDPIHREAAAAPAAERPSYEFDAAQSEVMASLGRAMRDVGSFLSVIGLLSILGGIARLFLRVGTWQQALAQALGSLLSGGIFLLIGVWTHGAGGHFQRVASTTGADVQHLLDALQELRHVYGLARTVLGAALILFAVATLLAWLATPVTGRW
jgi:hypothetical protein